MGGHIHLEKSVQESAKDEVTNTALFLGCCSDSRTIIAFKNFTGPCLPGGSAVIWNWAALAAFQELVMNAANAHGACWMTDGR